MFNPRLIRRQILGSRHQSIVFVLCVLLSMLTLVSLSGFSRSVRSSSLRDARELHAADIIIHSHTPFSSGLLAELSDLKQKKVIDSARITIFYSVVRAETQEVSLLAELKVVEATYPFYGKVELVSGRSFREVLTPGSLVVEQTLLDRLNLRPGDKLKIGNALLTIRDVVLLEPDRPVNIFALGPRVFISEVDLAALDLIGKGSRVDYRILVKVADERELERIAGLLDNAALPDRERVETYRTAGSGIKRFLDNFLFFLNLIGIFTLVLAGLGIESSLTAFLAEQERTIGIMKAVGAGSRFIISHYYAVVSVLGLFGTLVGIGASFLLQGLLPNLFHGLLPATVQLAISWSAVVEGLLLGLLVVTIFTFLPLYRLKEVKPRAIFGKEEPKRLPSRATWIFAILIAVFFVSLVLLRIGEVKIGAYFILGVGLLILVAWLSATGVLWALKKLRPANLVLRQALKGLFRPRNATLWIVVTLIAALVVIFSITLVEQNLEETFVRSYPADSPNIFFIDIQPGQKEAFAKELGIAAIYYPVVRGLITAVNGVTINREQEHRKRGDNLGREFSLTYRRQLLDDERLVTGQGLFRDDWSGPQVSVLDTVLSMAKMQVGDTIAFRIQGIPVEARISSIRTRSRASLQPFFYFVFTEEVLKDAPQTVFTALRVEKERTAALQNRIVARFPNISVIDVTATVAVFSRIMERLSLIVRFFALFSVAAGILIIVSSVFATRHTRIQEAVFFKILGARRRFVFAVFAVENLVLGLTSSLIALLLSQIISYIICRTELDLGYRAFPGISLLMVLAMTAMVIAVGLGASVSILRERPAVFLRQQSEEG